MTHTTDGQSLSEGESVRGAEADTLSTYLPQTARILKQSGATHVRAEYAKDEIRIMLFGEPRRMLAGEAAMVCVELNQQLTLLLRRRYPAHFEGDGSRGFFEWDLRTDTLRHEHTRIHHGV